jgi:hypothetical protein
VSVLRQNQGATTYGLPGDVKIDFVHLLTSEVWCERSRISLELKLLRKMLARATEEAECARGTADDAYGGGQSECYVKEFKRIMDCLKPLRDRRRLVHHKVSRSMAIRRTKQRPRINLDGLKTF